MTNRGLLAAYMVASIVVQTGCRRDTEASPTDREARVVMNVLSLFYGDYLDTHRGTPPPDSDTFRRFLESRQEDLQRYHVENPDQLLISPRDMQPLIIVCGNKRLAPADSPATPWAAYEQEGIDGKKMAVQVRGGVHDLSSDEISRIAAD